MKNFFGRVSKKVIFSINNVTIAEKLIHEINIDEKGFYNAFWPFLAKTSDFGDPNVFQK